MLRLKVAMLFITPLFAGGIAGALADTKGIPIWAWVCWGLGIAYLLPAMVYHLTQRIEIDVHECRFLLGSTSQNFIVAIEGFISSRHSIASIEWQLCLLGWRIGAVDDWSNIPSTINTIGENFRAVYNVSCDEFEEGRISQSKNKTIDIGKICVTTKDGCYLSEPFIIPGHREIFSKESWYRRMKKRIVSKKLKEREECITRKELDDLLKQLSE